MRKSASGAGRGRGKYKQMNDGVKLPRSSKVGPGAGGGGAAKGRASKVANLDELDMLHNAAITQIEHCNETSQLPSGNRKYFANDIANNSCIADTTKKVQSTFNANNVMTRLC